MSFWRRMFGKGSQKTLNPQRLDYLNEGLALERQGDFESALTSYRLAFRDNPADSRILLNMAEVFYIDSSGLGELVSAFTTVKNSGGQLKLLNLKSRVQDLMQLTRMHMVFDIYTDEKTALGSFHE